MRPIPITDDLVKAAQESNPGILVSTVEPSQWSTLKEPAQLITDSGILATIAGNPGYTLSRLLQTEKVVYLLQIITPFAFLPWRRGIGFVFCLPGVLMTLPPALDTTTR